MAGCAGCVVNAVQAVLNALVANTRGILAEICIFDIAEGRAAIPVYDISIIAGLVSPSHAIPTHQNALVDSTIQRKTVVAVRTDNRVICDIARKALLDRGTVGLAGKGGGVPVGKGAARGAGGVVGAVEAVLEAGVAGAGAPLAEEGRLNSAVGRAAVPACSAVVVAALAPDHHSVPAYLQAGVVRT